MCVIVRTDDNMRGGFLKMGLINQMCIRTFVNIQLSIDNLIFKINSHHIASSRRHRSLKTWALPLVRLTAFSSLDDYWHHSRLRLYKKPA